MSAVWRVARAAVRRRRLQTLVVGLVSVLSTATVTVALALLTAASGPFDAAFDRQHGAHLVAAFDAGKVSAGQLGARPAGVAAVAGPFAQAVLDVPATADSTLGPVSLTVAGRADPGGPVDRVEVWTGRWATGPGEIVLNAPPDRRAATPPGAGEQLHVPGGPTLTVVGRAYSVSHSADAWVAPAQISALRPTALQVLYRFSHADRQADLDAGLAAVRSGLPPDAVLGTRSYLTIKQALAAGPGAYLPFLVVFGVLGLTVAVLIVGNVVSGAVVTGLRHIGVLKALGFTPRAVVAIHLVMVLVPATAGAVLGTVAGAVSAQPLTRSAFQAAGYTAGLGADLAVILTALVVVPAVVTVAALVPALRAYRLPAARAISAGSAPRTGRGLCVQRRLSASRLPRPVGLGLGLPFARPGRTGLTLAAILLGVTTVTFATGLVGTVTRYAAAADTNNAAPVAVRSGIAALGEVATPLSGARLEALLRSLPGTAQVTASTNIPVTVAGRSGSLTGTFLRGDHATTGLPKQVIDGRWPAAPDEIAVPSAVLHRHALHVGDRLALQRGDRRVTVRIAGETLSGGVGANDFFATWPTLEALAPGYEPVTSEMFYEIAPAPGTDVTRYVEAVRAAAPGLTAWDNRATNDFTTAMVALSATLSVLLGVVAALGVLHTVLLNVHERRRDLGMLKAIGMTPRQVVAMTVTSMAALGLLGGLLGVPAGILAHRLITPLAARAAQISTPAFLLDVWRPATIGGLALSGIAIAIAGALIPARSAARLPVAQALHTE
ncbi:ABC transporter permease [Couchioplanes azureus]|uniref:ABC transporter permease n=1 Tax=Couchioplanes caeruleus TaxID=56438 RepID=UPI00167022F5|nr:ABC transporter permease [Couchioplanes caeruleus]GGQ48214.1 hypothetical protein GCM10010166_15460 [Couchioplanes caeruleus subsp. azureus]